MSHESGKIEIQDGATFQLDNLDTSIVDGYVLFNGCVIGETGCVGTLFIHAPNGTVIHSNSVEASRGQIRGNNNWEHPQFGRLAPGLITGGPLTITGSLALAGHLQVFVDLTNQAMVLVDDPRQVVEDQNDCVGGECGGGVETCPTDIIQKDTMLLRFEAKHGGTAQAPGVWHSTMTSKRSPGATLTVSFM